MPLPGAEPLTLLPSRSASRLLVPAGTPPSQWTQRTYDDTAWMPVVTPVGYDLVPAPIQSGTAWADSATGFSGVQGSNGWSYGYYHRSADANPGYDPGTDFNATDPNFGFVNGTWQLGAGGDPAANPPNVVIGPLDMHPNSVGGEHWAVRRYTCPAAGRLRIAGLLGNLSGLGSTTARLFVDGAQVFTTQVGAQGFAYSIFVTVNAGSRIDFALDPNGSDAGDATRWTAVLHPATSGAALVADSVTGFSGTQGANQWRYGIYNRSQDLDSHYDAATDFNSSPAGWTFQGGEWSLDAADPPWSALGAQHVHPNGLNDGEEHWVIRRWVSPVSGPVTVDWHFAKEIPYGEGATLLLLHNGVTRDSVVVAGDDRLGQARSVVLDVRAGDFLDFACTPVGPEGDDSDAADRCVFRARVYANPVHPGAVCVPVADSRADWSTNGQQGWRGWFYGYSDRSADITPGYQAADFRPFPSVGASWSPSNYWRGTDWDWNPDLTPWDNLGQTAAHPNGANNGGEHWVIRRWVSTTAGRLRANWFTRKSNPFGSGVTGKILHNGVERDSASIAAGDFTGVERTFDLATVSVGDTLDLALTPLGPGGAADDSGDGSAHGLNIAACQTVGDVVVTDIADVLGSAGGTVLLRIPFQVADTSCLETVTLRMRYDDGFVAWLNGTEIVRRNVSAAVPGELSTQALANRPPAQSLAAETLDITPFKHALVNGVNVLAIQGWNYRADDPDCLLAPELQVTANRAPQAGADGLVTTKDQPAEILVAQLLGNDLDPDGDNLGIAAASAASARGGVVQLGDGRVTYTPPAGFTGVDSFSYTVGDGRCGVTTATVEVLVASGNLPAPNQVRIEPKSSGFQVRFQGTAGVRYAIQRSADLRQWTTIDTRTAPVHGLIELDDQAAGPNAFYRTVLAP